MSELGIVLKQGSTTLADGNPANAIVAALSINGVRVIDESLKMLAAFVENFDRRTHRNTLQVTIARTHASRIAALDHVLMHPQLACAVDDLTLSLTEGSSTYIWQMLDAAWRQIASPAPTGVATPSVSYEISGGQILRSTTEDGALGGTWATDAIDGGTASLVWADETEIDGGGAYDIGTSYPAPSATIDGGTAANLAA